MRVSPATLSATVAGLFVVGSACFVVGSVPAYASAVGGSVDAITFVVGALFFTAASFGQLLQAQTPGMTDTDDSRQHIRIPVTLWTWSPHNRGWCAAAAQFPGTLFFNVSTIAALAHNLSVRQQDQHVWRPDVFGSTLFLVASTYGILAFGGRVFRFAPRSIDWWIAWLNMVGAVFFMIAAIASFVVPSTGYLLDSGVSVAGTLLGALCFLVGALLLFPSRRIAVARAEHR